MIAIGLMSGTSLDGIDAAVVRLVPRGRSYEMDLLEFKTQHFNDSERSALDASLPPNSGSARAIAELHHILGCAFAEAARAVAAGKRIDFIASHGQTVWHDGPAHVTLQVADPFIIRERLETTVCYDFRSADCAAGGQGAPLVPYVDALLLGSDTEARVAVNIGGIANLTSIPRGSGPQDVVAFDTGPGNMLLDAFVRERSDGHVAFDRDGKLAAKGDPDPSLLASMLDDAYFTIAPPKTTGRERFGAHFLRDHAGRLSQLSMEDGAATLAALTAETVARGVRSVAPRGARVLVSGGGANNPSLFEALRRRLEGYRVERSDAMNVHADAKEAIAFAVLGYETLRGRAGNVARATGATRSVLLGAIAPHNLPDLLLRVRDECRE